MLTPAVGAGQGPGLCQQMGSHHCIPELYSEWWQGAEVTLRLTTLTHARTPACESAGTLADRYGGKAVLAAGVALWSLFTGLTPQAAAAGVAPLLAARVLLGIGEGVAFPAVHAIVGEWPVG